MRHSGGGVAVPGTARMPAASFSAAGEEAALAARAGGEVRGGLGGPEPRRRGGNRGEPLLGEASPGVGERAHAGRSAGSTSSSGSRKTTSASPSSGVGSRLTITSRAPACAAAIGMEAAGCTTSDEPRTRSTSDGRRGEERRLQDVLGQRLAEGHRGRLQDPAAAVALRHLAPGREPGLDLVRGPLRAAAQARHAAGVAVQLEHEPAARVLVQAVDVLGDDAAQPARALRRRQRPVRRVGLRARDVGVGLLAVVPVPPPRLRVGDELLEGNRLEAAPDAARRPEVGHPGRGAHARPRERERALRLRDEAARPVEKLAHGGIVGRRAAPALRAHVYCRTEIDLCDSSPPPPDSGRS